MENIFDMPSAIGRDDIFSPLNKASNPYVIQIANTSNKVLTAILFGFNINWHNKNFGNPKGIEITNLNGTSYGHLFSQSASSPFKTGTLRFQCQDGKTLDGKKSIVHADADGCMYTSPLITLVDPYQFQTNVIQLNKEITVDGNCYITCEMQPKSTMVICIYPVQKVSLARLLNNVRQFLAPMGPAKLNPIKARAYKYNFLLRTWLKIQNFFTRNKIAAGPPMLSPEEIELSELHERLMKQERNGPEFENLPKLQGVKKTNKLQLWWQQVKANFKRKPEDNEFKISA